jgi:hypothetical protein
LSRDSFLVCFLRARACFISTLEVGVTYAAIIPVKLCLNMNTHRTQMNLVRTRTITSPPSCALHEYAAICSHLQPISTILI